MSPRLSLTVRMNKRVNLHTVEPCREWLVGSTFVDWIHVVTMGFWSVLVYDAASDHKEVWVFSYLQLIVNLLNFFLFLSVCFQSRVSRATR